MSNIRNRIEKRFFEFGLLVSRRPWLFIIGSAIAVVAMVWQLPHIMMDTSAEGLLHKEDPILTVYEDFRREFGRDQIVIIGLYPEEVFNSEFLGTLKDLHEALEQEVPYVSEVTSLINAEYIRGEGDDLIVEDLLEDLPEDEEEMLELRERILANPIYRNVLISDDGSFTVLVLKTILFSPNSGVEGVLLSEKEVSEFVESVNKVCNRFRSRDFPIHLGGDIIAENILKNLTMSTLYRFTLITSLVIVIIFIFLFRRLSGFILPMLVVNLALFSTLGLMAAWGVPITLNTTILPSFLLAVGIGDSVHILAIYFKEINRGRDKAEAISFSLGHSGLAIVMTSLTTASGLLSFVSSGIAPVANLGIFAAVGVMLALIFTIVTLPAFLAVTPMSRRLSQAGTDSHSRLDGLLAGIGDFATGHPWKVVICSFLLFIGALVLSLQLKFSHNSLNYLREDVPVRMATELIDNKMKGSVSVDLLVDTGEPQGLYNPSVMTGIEEAQNMTADLLIDGRNVGRASAVTDMLKEINQALNGGDSSEYRIPDDRELIAQELLLYEVGGGEDLSKAIDRDHARARITLRLPWVDAVVYTRVIAEFEQRVKRLFAGTAFVEVTGLAPIIVKTLTTIIQTMGKSYLIAGSVITILMILFIGNVRLGLSSMAPNFLPIVLGLGLMKLTSIPLDYSTIMVGGIAIGLAVDDTVHFMHNFRRYHDQTGDVREAVRLTLTTSGRAMLFTTIILGAGFFILLFAELNSTRHFGIITGFTICMALLADFLLAPAMMALLAGRKREDAA